MRTPDYTAWQEGCAHDPSLLEWEGVYYAYSTDTFGAPCGYQIRKSTDQIGRASCRERVLPRV